MSTEGRRAHEEKKEFKNSHNLHHILSKGSIFKIAPHPPLMKFMDELWKYEQKCVLVSFMGSLPYLLVGVP